jgi:16S rRNA (guanine527-N7)-methyltransferase
MTVLVDELHDVSRETRHGLERYVELLLSWNRTINLISRRDEANVWTRHVADVLQLIPLLPPHFSHAVDLGSGAGLPGLVLALVTRKTFHLIESDQRKCAFLREAVRMTNAPVIIHATRIQEAHITPASVVTARALGPLDQLLAWTAPLLASGGICLFPKGSTAGEELERASRQWHMRCEKIVSRTNPSATILRLREIVHVGLHA